MKLLSLFSGIGAFEKALTNLGIEYDLVAYCEIDKFASKAYTLIHNVPEYLNFGDITKINEKTLPTDIDLITYGFPCQDISTAGLQRGFFREDGSKTRSGLFFDALRIIQATKPKIAIAENVKNLTGRKMVQQFQTVLNGLEEAGYNNYWSILNAEDYGIPQHRERLFIVSIRKDIDKGKFTFPAPVPLTTCMNDFLEDEVDESYYYSDDYIRNVKSKRFNSERDRIQSRGGSCRTLLAHDYKGPVIVADLNHYGNDQMNRIFSPEGLSPTLKTVSGGGREVKVQDGERYRKLTPREYMRLMGFTDRDVDVLIENGISKTQIYKVAGNSIVVPVLEHLFRQIYGREETV
ncbi:MAG: DNA cytosine methyltransferase [Alloprevotella sp.]|nr:DNA cytosine methyltransferase [Alloprevotella sp.]